MAAYRRSGDVVSELLELGNASPHSIESAKARIRGGLGGQRGASSNSTSTFAGICAGNRTEHSASGRTMICFKTALAVPV